MIPASAVRPTAADLRDAAWLAIEPHFEQRLSVLLDAYGEARAHGRGSDRNPVRTLLVVAERQIPGSVAADAGTGGK